MQIFLPDHNYHISADSLDDRRLNKQIIELCQILSTAVWLENCNIAEILHAKGKIKESLLKIESTNGGYFYSREVSGYEATLYVEYILD